MVPRDGVEPPTPAFSGLGNTCRPLILLGGGPDGKGSKTRRSAYFARNVPARMKFGSSKFKLTRGRIGNAVAKLVKDPGTQISVLKHWRICRRLSASILLRGSVQWRRIRGRSAVGEKQNGPFQIAFNSCLEVDFRGSPVISGGGLILMLELDEHLGLGDRMARHLTYCRRKDHAASAGKRAVPIRLQAHSGV